MYVRSHFGSSLGSAHGIMRSLLLLACCLVLRGGRGARPPGDSGVVVCVSGTHGRSHPRVLRSIYTRVVEPLNADVVLTLAVRDAGEVHRRTPGWSPRVHVQRSQRERQEAFSPEAREAGNFTSYRLRRRPAYVRPISVIILGNYTYVYIYIYIYIWPCATEGWGAVTRHRCFIRPISLLTLWISEGLTPARS